MKRRVFLTGSVAFVASSFGAAATNTAVALSGDRFRIGEQEFQLANILAPSAYTLGAAVAPYTDEARARLQHHIVTTDFDFIDAAPPTRWGARVVKTNAGENAPSLEELLISDGTARVAPQTDDVTFVERLLAVEQAARQDKKGLWALDAYQAFDADDASDAIGAYHLIEGSVASARMVRSRFYLNFGGDYRTDFTASTVSTFYRKWLGAGFDLKKLAGARVRIRGFVVSINGPSIDLTNRCQIEILSPV